jgi:biotin-dependent carboxylase-like uncharacterized protein
MSNGLLEVIHAGLGNGLQDNGRVGYRHMGITVSGCLDPLLARCANALVGNDADAACVEIRVLGPILRVIHGPVRVAIAGYMVPKVRRADGRQEAVPAWSSVTLDPGDELEAGTVKEGIAYLAVGGGVSTPLHLGSRSTYQRALIGGIDGHLLTKGHLLPSGTLADRLQGERIAPPWTYPDGPVRVMLGPQDGHFPPDSIGDFLSLDYTVSPQMDRMGMRLEGTALIHRTPACADIVSDGVTPGAIQVPGNGQPIILLADCQTVGGYPKIATVISADLPRLAQMKPGRTLRFKAVNAEEAKAALLEREARWQEWCKGIQVLPSATESDEEGDALYVAV